jgi:hypothetical protein
MIPEFNNRGPWGISGGYPAEIFFKNGGGGFDHIYIFGRIQA